MRTCAIVRTCVHAAGYRAYGSSGRYNRGMSPQPEFAALVALADAVKLLAAAATGCCPVPYGPQRRLILAVDIIGFNDPRRDDEIQLALRRALYLILTRAFAAAQVPWPRIQHEDRGDGVLMTLPAEVPATVVTGPLLAHVRDELRLHNRLSSAAAQFGLRVSAHIGEVHHDEHGLVGRAVNHVFRLLEAPAFKDRAGCGTGLLAVILSDAVHSTLLRDGPTEYQPVIAVLKETRSPAWVHITDDTHSHTDVIEASA